MSNAEHLIENAIYALQRGEDVLSELDHFPNDVMLKETGIDKYDTMMMANHVVYSLYDGLFPDDDKEKVVYCKNCKHRDPEDKKCDCGELERAGCVFRVADDYFCAHGERMKNNE